MTAPSLGPSFARRAARLGLVIALALVLRIDAAWTAGGVWRDEANDLFLCRNNPTAGALLRATEAEGSPPLRFLVECSVERWSAGSLVVSRGLVIAFGTLAVAIVALMAARLFGPLAGVVAGTLGATSPFLIRFSVELRGYALYQLAAAAYAVAIVAFLNRRTPRRAVVAGVAAAALLLTHYAGLYLVAAATAWLVAIEARGRRERATIALSIVVTLLLVLPAAPAFARQAAGDLRGWVVPDRKGLDLVRVASLALGSWGVAIAAGACGWWAWRIRRGAPASVGAPWSVLIAGAVGGNVLAWLVQFIPPFKARLEPWYLAGMAIWLLPPVGAAIGNLVARARRRTLGLAAAGALVFWSQAADARNWLKPRSAGREIARIVEREEHPGDLIVIVPAAHASTFNFYYRGSLDEWAPPLRGRVTNVPWRELARALDDDDERTAVAAEVAMRLRRGARVWLVAGGPSIDREEDPARAPTAYARATLLIRRDVVRALFANGEAVRFAEIPALDYWEPAELLLFTHHQ